MMKQEASTSFTSTDSDSLRILLTQNRVSGSTPHEDMIWMDRNCPGDRNIVNHLLRTGRAADQIIALDPIGAL